MPIPAVLLESVGGVYHLLPDGTATPVEAFLRGRLKQDVRTGDRLVAGDRVLASRREDGTWTIESVEPRASELVRGGLRGRKAKIVAANVDRAVVVIALGRPELREETLDRFLVLAELSGLEPVVVANKRDLPGASEKAEGIEARLAPAGYPVIRTCALSGEGVDRLAAQLAAHTSVIMGPSGVGKSSLLNAVSPTLTLRTGEVGRKRGAGRHTTVSARLVPLHPGTRADAPTGWVVDTPGFSEVLAWQPEPGDVGRAFPEMRERAEGCHFRGCTHLHEPGCAVREAIEAGEIHPGRFDSYRRIMTGE
jgi:ribosome biogenesis GTPase / thiamine phosphate phosphatase